MDNEGFFVSPSAQRSLKFTSEIGRLQYKTVQKLVGTRGVGVMFMDRTYFDNVNVLHFHFVMKVSFPFCFMPIPRCAVDDLIDFLLNYLCWFCFSTIQLQIRSWRTVMERSAFSNTPSWVHPKGNLWNPGTRFWIPVILISNLPRVCIHSCSYGFQLFSGFVILIQISILI